MSRRLAVIGNGAAGALVVAGLLRRASGPLDIAWIGDGEPARGVAYATPHSWHRLNVPAPAMSVGDTAFPDWLAARGLDDDPFAPRHAFGTYLVESLEKARADAEGGVRLVEHRGRAVDVVAGDDLRFVLPDGTAVRADAAVLALGPFPSPPLPELGPEVAGHPAVIADPWDGRVEQTPDGASVLLVGSGLTMVDVALTVGRYAPRARLTAASRTGLLPRAHDHDEGPAADPVVRPRPGLRLDDLVAGIEAGVDARGGRWREVVDGLRPVTPDLWRSLARDEQRRYLAEQARRWETHRHRMAPRVAAELDGLRSDGRLAVHEGGVSSIEVDGDRVRAVLGDGDEEVVADRVVSCTGAQDDVTAVDDPLVASLLDGGLARAHPLGLGFDTGELGALDDAGRLFGIGTLRRGERYETTAIPEIAEQAEALAGHLLGGQRGIIAAKASSSRGMSGPAGW